MATSCLLAVVLLISPVCKAFHPSFAVHRVQVSASSSFRTRALRMSSPPTTETAKTTHELSHLTEQVTPETKDAEDNVYRIYTVEQLRYILDECKLPLKCVDVRGDTSPLCNNSRIHPVAAAMHKRTREGSMPGQRTDNIKIAMAVEGGGMRGCVAAGMVTAVHVLGLSDSVDSVYGSSAGALVGTYFISRQIPRFGCSVYYESLPRAGKSFINLRAALRSLGLGWLDLSKSGVQDMLKDKIGIGDMRPVLNLDVLLTDIMQKEKKLDWETFLKNNKVQPLKVVASALDSQQSMVLSSENGNFRSITELAQCLRASMLLPGIAGPLVRIPGGPPPETPQGQPLADALLYEPIPYRSALSQGATHVLVLRTKADGQRVVGKMSVFERAIARRFFKRKNDLPSISQHMTTQGHKKLYAEDILRLNKDATDLSGTRSPLLMPVALGQDTPEIPRLSTDRAAIYEGVRHGFARTYDALVEDRSMEGRGMEVALQVFPDSLLDQLNAQEKAERRLNNKWRQILRNTFRGGKAKGGATEESSFEEYTW